MRISSNSLSKRNGSNAQNQNELAVFPLRTIAWKSVLIGMASAVVLSGCLLEGDLSGEKSRSELITSLEEANTDGTVSSSSSAERGTGESGTTGTGTSGTDSGTGTSGTDTGTGTSGTDTGTGANPVVEPPPSTGALTNSDLMDDHYPGTNNYSKQIDLPSCDAADALRISTPEGLGQIITSNYRVFCIAPGDYRSYGKLAISGGGGTESLPKVIRFESSNFGDDEEIFTANISDLARMPEMDIRNTNHWVLNRLAFIGISGMPIRLSGANHVVIDRIRLQNNRNGIEIRHGTMNSYIQNSYIGDQVVPKGSGNDGVCVAFMGHFKQYALGGNIDYDYPVVAAGNHIVNNEIFNCNDGIQFVWMHHYSNIPNFQGTVIAGNDIYVDRSVRTNCYGTLDTNGNCAYTENPLDIKAGSLDASDPVRVYDNRMWGYRKTDSSYNGPANSWATGISGHYRSVQNIHIYENIIWDVPSAISFTRGTKNSIIRDNIFAQITGAGPNNGIALITSTDESDLNSGSYQNVSNMTVEKNHIIVSSSAGNSTTTSAWYMTSATNSSVSCNVVTNGSWTSVRGSGTSASNNTYYNTNSGSLGSGSDRIFSSSASSNMGDLCFDTKKASITGGEQVCLAGVLDSPQSTNTCASDYWTTANWQ